MCPTFSVPYWVMGVMNMRGYYLLILLVFGMFVYADDCFYEEDGRCFQMEERADLDGEFIHQASDGGYIIKDGNNIIKTDSDWDIEWEREFDVFDDYYINSFRQTMDGGFIFVGKISGPEITAEDILIVKTDEYGNVEWLHNYDAGEDYVEEGEEPYYPNADGKWVEQAKSGGYVVLGRTAGFQLDTMPWLLWVDSDGVVVSSKVGNEDTREEDFVSTHDKEIYSLIFWKPYDGAYNVYHFIEDNESQQLKDYIDLPYPSEYYVDEMNFYPTSENSIILVVGGRIQAPYIDAHSQRLIEIFPQDDSSIVFDIGSLDEGALTSLYGIDKLMNGAYILVISETLKESSIYVTQYNILGLDNDTIEMWKFPISEGQIGYIRTISSEEFMVIGENSARYWIEYLGTFDSDGDGLADEDDECPSENPEGLDADENGCTDDIEDLLEYLCDNNLGKELKNIIKQWEEGSCSNFAGYCCVVKNSPKYESYEDVLVNFAQNICGEQCKQCGKPPHKPPENPPQGVPEFTWTTLLVTIAVGSVSMLFIRKK